MTAANGADASASAAHAAARRAPVRGVYAVSPDLDDTGLLVALIDAALAGGVRLVQYRHKTGDDALRRVQATRLAALCASYGRPLIVNDHVELALSVDGAGLHVGADDHAGPDDLRALRRRLGDARLLGVSCYRNVALAADAVAAGVDYVAFGSVFASGTKPDAPPAALETFAAARGLGVPLVGIGGITRTNLPALLAAGADAAAVIGELFSDPDPVRVQLRARALADVFDAAGGAATTTSTDRSPA